MSDLFNNVKVGDTVHYSTPQGQYGKGKVVIKHESGSHVVINRGKGQPQVVNDKNYVKHERGGKVIGALLSKLAAHDKYMKSIKEGKTGSTFDMRGSVVPLQALKADREAKAKKALKAGNKLSPYKLGEPQDNASKAFGWTKTNEGRNSDADADEVEAKRPKAKGKTVAGKDSEKGWVGQSKEYYDKVKKVSRAVKKLANGQISTRNSAGVVKVFGASERKKARAYQKEDRRTEGPYGGHPYDWDVEMRKQVFAAAAKKVKQKGPPDNHRDYKPNKLGPPPRRGTTSEDAADAEGQAARVTKTKHKKKSKLHELNNSTLTSYVTKAIADRKARGSAELGRLRTNRPEYYANDGGANKKLDKRSKGIKTAVGKIASKLPGEKVTEGTRSEYDANINMAQSSKPTAKGHYLMRDGRKLSGPHSPDEAVKAYKGLSSQGTDTKGVKIVHVKEGVETDVTAMLMETLAVAGVSKYKKAAQKAVTLAKAKGNKHVDTKPTLNLPDKGTGGPVEGSEQGERNGKV